MMCAHLLKDQRNRRHGKLYQSSESLFNGMLSIYGRSLAWALQNRGLMLFVLLMTVALNVWLIVRIPKGFFPQQDTGAIIGGVQGPQDASFSQMDNSIRQLVDVVKADPAVANVIAFTGGGPSNGGFIYIALKPLDVRKVTAPDIINRLRNRMIPLPVASAFFQAAQDLRIGGRVSNALYQYTIQSSNVRELSQWGPYSARPNENSSRPPRCELRPAEQRLGRVRHLRPHHRRKAGDHFAVAGLLVVQRFRPS